MKSSADRISSEGLFVYMAITAVLLCPIALLMTNFSEPINWRLSGLYLSGSLQLLNSLGALLLIYAIRWGKAIIVVPMINGLFPMVTIVLSLFIYHRIPTTYNFIGLFLAIVAIFLMAFDEVKHSTPPQSHRLRNNRGRYRQDRGSQHSNGASSSARRIHWRRNGQTVLHSGHDSRADRGLHS